VSHVCSGSDSHVGGRNPDVRFAPAPYERTSLQFFFNFVSPSAGLRPSVSAAWRSYARTVAWRPLLLGVTVTQAMGLPPLLQTPVCTKNLNERIDDEVRQG
jgi:2-hydroxychromene-2-carboxylate isomerase